MNVDLCLKDWKNSRKGAESPEHGIRRESGGQMRLERFLLAIQEVLSGGTDMI
jgi:hypothetical protein